MSPPRDQVGPSRQQLKGRQTVPLLAPETFRSVTPPENRLRRLPVFRPSHRLAPSSIDFALSLSLSAVSLIYLDYNRTTPMAPSVLEAMQPFWSTHFMLPGQEHPYAQAIGESLENARESVYVLVCLKRRRRDGRGKTHGRDVIVHMMTVIEQYDSMTFDIVRMTYLQ